MTTVYGKLKRKGRAAFSSEEFKESGWRIEGERGPSAPPKYCAKLFNRQGTCKIGSTTRLWGLCRHCTLYFHKHKWTGAFLYHYSFSCRCCHGGDIHVEDYKYAAASELHVKGQGPFGEIGYGGHLVDASSTSRATEAWNDVTEGRNDPARAACEHRAHLCSASCRCTAVPGSDIVSWMQPFLFFFPYFMCVLNYSLIVLYNLGMVDLRI
jgi:hypothetical protein